MRRLDIAAVSDILRDAPNRAENSTVQQGGQGTGYASPMAAVTALRLSALGQPSGANAPPWQVLPNPDFGTYTYYRSTICPCCP